jgi:(1->4)-alpha-D-glucan 1-alpha-D-glucosylmutase
MTPSPFPDVPGEGTRLQRHNDMTDTEIDNLLRTTLADLLAQRRVPTSTYRLQFHKGFTFRDAAAIVPYLHSLGITHCYASPYLKATPGSTHGYDVVDHAQLNPELGTREDYDAWMNAMRDVGMSHIVDIVPNHMGVATDENHVWNDMLEDGPAAEHGSFFDVAWTASPRPELKDRILIPTLGEPYGSVLDKGQLKLGRSPDGGFHVAYFDRHFPVALTTYDMILRPLAIDDDEMHAELQGIIDATRRLPPARAGEADGTAKRGWAKRAIKRRIRALIERSDELRIRLDRAIVTFNGTVGDSKNFDRIHELLASQNYRLAYWRTASDEINYRRFFDVSTLAALAMERAEVFEESHELIFELIGEGHITGLRIDHSDGLYDPKIYFRRLQRRYLEQFISSAVDESVTPEQLARAIDAVLPDEATDQPLYVVAEKILAPGEPLPTSWAMAGTSGYDVLNEISGLFVDPAGEHTLDTCYRNFVGHGVAADYHELTYRKRREVLVNSFAGELNLLAHQLDRLAQQDRHSRDFTLDVLRDALTETIASFGVYRAYVTADDGASPRDVEMIEAAIARAGGRDAAIEACVFHFLRDLLLLRGPLIEKTRDEVIRFVGKFQQLTSPVTAKGLEDTAFYIYHRLISLNEVGGEPSRFGVSIESLHDTLAARQRDWPEAMSVLSTHDTKRAEDVRARIHVLSELADEWTREVGRWHAINRSEGVHPNDEYLLYQTLAGAWPNGPLDDEFVKRIDAYMLKALREAKERTSWSLPSESVEKAMAVFVTRILDASRGREFQEAFVPFQKRVARVGMVNSLAQTLLRLTAPGVPDTYQGTELWDLSLVDPDNRRPVDYAVREKFLATLPREATPAAARDLVEHWPDGRAKLWVTATALRLRRERAELFERGEYVPVHASGARAKSVFAFERRLGDWSILTIVPRVIAAATDANGRVDWQDTRIDLPAGAWRNALTGEVATDGSLASLLCDFPVALLVR